MRQLLVIAVLAAGAIGVVRVASEQKTTSSPTSAEPVAAKQETEHTFGKYSCSLDCSGHRAGYDWAKEKDIQDEEDCEAAGEHSNSLSFAEGCKAYVNGESDSESDNEGDGDR
jgi:hypothetical protein